MNNKNKILEAQIYATIGVAIVFLIQILLRKEIDYGFWLGVLLIKVVMYLPVVYYFFKENFIKSN